MTTTLHRLGAALSDRYRVDRELGAGGMATVFLAHDLRHERDVAIKVLHPELGAALGAERFLGEIRTTARLQHPNILPLLDSGEADGLLFYVMPLVEGETLRQRLERERQLPIDASLRIATEVAEALGYAHRHGVIHRDIKPENILLHDGRPIVADFGIALAVTAASGSRMTQTGLSLGTPQYMAPEQAMGDKHIDARADVYALGAVTYEMLTGEPPFSGATVQAIVAKVLTERPLHPTSVRDTIPRHVEATVLKALAKLPADRFDTATAFAHALHHAGDTSELTAARPVAAMPARGLARVVGSRTLPWTVAGVSLLAAIWAWTTRPTATTSPEPALLGQVPDVTLTPLATLGAIGRAFALSRDGSHLAWLGRDTAGTDQVYVGALGGRSPRPLPGTEDALSVFISPDGRRVGFIRSGEIMVTIADGGQPRRIAAAGVAGGVTWASDAWIVFGRNRGVFRVRATGGEPEQIISGGTDTTYHSPSFIEETGTVIVSRIASGVTDLVATPIEGGAITPLGITAQRGAYARGVLVYATSDGSLWGVPFDPRRLRATGEPAPIGDASFRTSARFDLSRSGVLTFAAIGSPPRDLMLVDRAGRSRVLSDRRIYRFPRFSPSGSRIMVGILGLTASTREGDLWSIDIGTGVRLRVTTDSVSTRPSWTRDGRSLVFTRRTSAGRMILARATADGTTQPTTLLERPGQIFEAEFTADGRTLVIREDNPGTGRDIIAVPVDTPSAVRPILQTRFDERGIAVGPEGDWLAYVSNESGRDEVYIRRLAPESPRWPVSRNGGVEPRWTRSGEVFFRKADSVFATRVTLGAEPRVTEPVLLFTGQYLLQGFESMWDAAPDGQSFVMVHAPTEARPPVMLYANWIEPWKRAVAAAAAK